MVERDLAKVDTRVRFPSLAPEKQISSGKIGRNFLFPNCIGPRNEIKVTFTYQIEIAIKVKVGTSIDDFI